MSAGRITAAWIPGLGLVVGCRKDSTGPTLPSMTGTWQGSGASQFVTMTLSESNTHVTGSGTISDGVATALLAITGTHSHPQVSLTVTPAGFTPITATGSHSGADSVVAQLNGSGFSNFAMTFVRQ
jgi:hypothetical protein